MLDAPLGSSGDSDRGKKPWFNRDRGERYRRGNRPTVLNARSFEQFPVKNPPFKFGLDEIFEPFHVVEKVCDETVNLFFSQAYIISVIMHPRL